MRLTWLAWYHCGLFLFAALAASAVTYHPDAQHLSVLAPAVLGGLGIMAGVAAASLTRLSAQHPVHQSKPLLGLLSATAIIATLTAVLSVAG